MTSQGFGGNLAPLHARCEDSALPTLSALAATDPPRSVRAQWVGSLIRVGRSTCLVRRCLVAVAVALALIKLCVRSENLARTCRLRCGASQSQAARNDVYQTAQLRPCDCALHGLVARFVPNCVPFRVPPLRTAPELRVRSARKTPGQSTANKRP